MYLVKVLDAAVYFIAIVPPSAAFTVMLILSFLTLATELITRLVCKRRGAGKLKIILNAYTVILFCYALCGISVGNFTLASAVVLALVYWFFNYSVYLAFVQFARFTARNKAKRTKSKVNINVEVAKCAEPVCEAALESKKESLLLPLFEYYNNRENNFETGLQLEHAFTVLSSIKKAKLTPADRIEADRIERLLSTTRNKKTGTASEIEMVNDCLCVLLKMLAKYA